MGMAEYSEENLPVTIHPEDLVRFKDGTTVRFDVNGEGKDIMLNDDFTAACELYPGNEFVVSANGRNYRISTDFEDTCRVEAM
jgi:hypothetical protein